MGLVQQGGSTFVLDLSFFLPSLWSTLRAFSFRSLKPRSYPFTSIRINKATDKYFRANILGKTTHWHPSAFEKRQINFLVLGQLYDGVIAYRGTHSGSTTGQETFRQLIWEARGVESQSSQDSGWFHRISLKPIQRFTSIEMHRSTYK